MKVTFEIEDPELYRAIKVEAARRDRSVREIVEEALEAWLEHIEEADDAAAATEALAEYERDGGLAAEAFLADRAAEVRARYGER
ncbi:MAG: ribbon-helix-helix protein, CopG family [Candidatus Limnocylindrales bacterium]